MIVGLVLLRPLLPEVAQYPSMTLICCNKKSGPAVVVGFFLVNIMIYKNAQHLQVLCTRCHHKWSLSCVVFLILACSFCKQIFNNICFSIASGLMKWKFVFYI